MSMEYWNLNLFGGFNTWKLRGMVFFVLFVLLLQISVVEGL